MLNYNFTNNIFLKWFDILELINIISKKETLSKKEFNDTYPRTKVCRFLYVKKFPKKKFYVVTYIWPTMFSSTAF